MSPWVGPIPPVVKIGRSALSDDRSLLVANHPHFLEIDADRRQIFRDIADVLVLGAAGQDLATDHQERGRDGLFGSGRICGCHDHLQENAPNDGPTQDGETRELVVRPYTAIVGYAASSHRRGKLEKRLCATICNTQASRGGLTPHQPAIPRQGGYLRTEDAAGRQQKGFPMITRRNCLIGASAALIGVLFEPETSWRSAVCRFNAPTMAFAIGYESIAFIALENCGVAP